MRLSIIIPVLDEAENIQGSLQALEPLRRRGHEVIVVDGGSADATMERAQDRADRLLRAPRGRARQMNAGASAASGDVLLFLHADTRLPDAADGVIEAALARPAAVWGRFDVSIEGSSALLPLVARLMNLRSRWTGIATGDQAMFVESEVFRRVGGFSPLDLMEDVDLSARLKRMSRPLCLRQVVVTSGRRWETHGVLRTIALMWWLRLRFFFGADAGALARSYHR